MYIHKTHTYKPLLKTANTYVVYNTLPISSSTYVTHIHYNVKFYVHLYFAKCKDEKQKKGKHPCSPRGEKEF